MLPAAAVVGFGSSGPLWRVWGVGPRVMRRVAVAAAAASLLA